MEGNDRHLSEKEKGKRQEDKAAGLFPASFHSAMTSSVKVGELESWLLQNICVFI